MEISYICTTQYMVDTSDMWLTQLKNFFLKLNELYVPSYTYPE